MYSKNHLLVFLAIFQTAINISTNYKRYSEPFKDVTSQFASLLIRTFLSPSLLVSE